ncbi:MAG: hypothetical protein ACLFUB_09985 [Cyclobacteriaceae bacterium]
MNIFHTLTMPGCGFLVNLFFYGKKKQADSRPNIVLIMSDDMGDSGLGCFGSEKKTPCLDRLALERLRMT